MKKDFIKIFIEQEILVFLNLKYRNEQEKINKELNTNHLAHLLNLGYEEKINKWMLKNEFTEYFEIRENYPKYENLKRSIKIALENFYVDNK